MSKDEQSERFHLSRRRFLSDSLCGVALAAGFSILYPASVSALTKYAPPRWLQELKKITDRITLPTIPRHVERITPVAGDCRAVIQGALDRVNTVGGGKVILAPGTWQSFGGIRLTSNLELHLERGAQLVFSADAEHYLPLVHTRWEGTELFGYMPCVYAYHANNVALTGAGSISMAGTGSMYQWRKEQSNAQARLRSMGAEGAPLHERVFGKGRFLRPSCVQFFGCRNVLVEGVSLSNLLFWGVHLVFTHSATLRNVSVQSSEVNGDGIDIDSSSCVVVERCTLDTGDDAIAIKSGRDKDGRAAGAPSEDIVIRDCLMTRSGSSGIAVGSEMSGGVRRVYVIRCTMGEVHAGITIKSNLDRGGVVEHLRVWKISVKRCARLVQVTTAYHGYAGGEHPPIFRDIELDELSAGAAREGFSLLGSSRSPVAGVVIKHVHIEDVTTPLVVDNGRDISLSDVVMNGAPVML